MLVACYSCTKQLLRREVAYWVAFWVTRVTLYSPVRFCTGDFLFSALPALRGLYLFLFTSEKKVGNKTLQSKGSVADAVLVVVVVVVVAPQLLLHITLPTTTTSFTAKTVARCVGASESNIRRCLIEVTTVRLPTYKVYIKLAAK